MTIIQKLKQIYQAADNAAKEAQVVNRDLFQLEYVHGVRKPQIAELTGLPPNDPMAKVRRNLLVKEFRDGRFEQGKFPFEDKWDYVREDESKEVYQVGVDESNRPVFREKKLTEEVLQRLNEFSFLLEMRRYEAPSWRMSKTMEAPLFLYEKKEYLQHLKHGKSK